MTRKQGAGRALHHGKEKTSTREEDKNRKQRGEKQLRSKAKENGTKGLESAKRMQM